MKSVFDPFVDFHERGYLRNRAALKNLRTVKRMEHAFFLANLHRAIQHLQSTQEVGYRDVLKVHKILFGELYPWAGEDRKATAPQLAIARGGVVFAHPDHIERAASYALQVASDTNRMNDRPGEVLQLLAYAHPFLDGNGRTLLVVFSELARRAGFMIDWRKITQAEFMDALTNDIEAPESGSLDLLFSKAREPLSVHKRSHWLHVELHLQVGRGKRDCGAPRLRSFSPKDCFALCSKCSFDCADFCLHSA